MARIVSPVWTTIRGSIGGTNYLSGPHHGIIARTRSSPVRPSSQDSTLYRSCFAHANLVWKLLPPSVRVGWNDYARTLYFADATGQYTVTGRNAFLGYYPLHHYCNSLGLTSVPPITTPSKLDGWLPLILHYAIQKWPPIGELVVDIVNPSSIDVVLVYLQISKPFDSTRQFFKGPWTTRNAAVVFIAVDRTTKYTFTGLVPGKRYFVRARAFTRFPAGARYSRAHSVYGNAF